MLAKPKGKLQNSTLGEANKKTKNNDSKIVNRNENNKEQQISVPSLSNEKIENNNEIIQDQSKLANVRSNKSPLKSAIRNSTKKINNQNSAISVKLNA